MIKTLIIGFLQKYNNQAGINAIKYKRIYDITSNIN